MMQARTKITGPILNAPAEVRTRRSAFFEFFHAQLGSRIKRRHRRAPKLELLEIKKEGEAENGKPKNGWKDPMRLKYNAACIFGTCTALLGTYIGAHVTEMLTGSRMAAATGGSLLLSLIAGNGGFAIMWGAIRSRDLKDWKALLGEVLDKVVKNLTSSVPSVLSRIPVSAAAVLLGRSSEWSGVAGFIVAQLVFYSTANALYGVKLGRKNQKSEGNANIVLEQKASHINGESQNGDIRG